MKYLIVFSLVASVMLASCSSDKEKVASTDPSLDSPAEYVARDGTIHSGKPSSRSVQDHQSPVVPKTPSVPSKPAVFAPQSPRMPGLRVARVNVPRKVVALTFDDGPHGSLTPKVLDILARYNVKCTFFLQGINVKRYPNVVARMAREGHEPASHTWNHICMTRSSRATCESQLRKTDDAIREITGVSPKLVRPPYGAVNASLYTWMNQSFGYKTVLWDVDTNDWRKPGVSTVVSRAVNGARPGSIILVHDIHSSTVQAIDGIVRGLIARGFQLVTVSDLIAIGQRYAASAPTSSQSSKPGVSETANGLPVVRQLPADSGSAGLPGSTNPSNSQESETQSSASKQIPTSLDEKNPPSSQNAPGNNMPNQQLVPTSEQHQPKVVAPSQNGNKSNIQGI